MAISRFLNRRTFTLGLFQLTMMLGAAGAATAQDYRQAVAALQAAEKDRQPDQFAAAARTVLRDDSARAVRDVVEAYGRLSAGRPALDLTVHYRLHSELAKELGEVKSPQARDEVARQLGRGRDWQSRLVCLDASSFHPREFGLRQGALNLLKEKTPALIRRSLFYLQNDRQLPTLDAILARYFEVELPKGPKGQDWDRVRFAFHTALSRLIRFSLPAAVDYKNYIDARRDKPEELFDRPPPERGPTRLSLFGAEVTGNNIIFVLDVSGSMLASDPVKVPISDQTLTAEKARELLDKRLEERRRMTRARTELIKVVNDLPTGKRFNLIAYSSDVVSWKKLLAPVNDATRKEAVAFIEGLKAEGVTVTDDALEAAFGDLAVDTIYLITDGAPTHVGTPGNAPPPDSEAIIRRIHERMEELNYFRGVRIFTLGFPEAEEHFLQKLASDHGGSYTPIR